MEEESSAVRPPRADDRRAPRLTYEPALDGLRGVAVAAVLLFHAGLTLGGDVLAEGGYLGVSTFFTLSGFLITCLLLTERRATGTVALGRFWGRRFRRLMPAAVATLLLVMAYAQFAANDPTQLARLRGDLLGALVYVANWRFILSGQSYADLFAEPSPVLHFWSLAIEEQFYLFYPLVVAGLLAAVRGSRRTFAAVLAVLTVVSVVLMLVLYHSDVSLSRLYYGTDTRAAEMLVGALLGVWATSRWSGLSPRASRIVQWLGAGALAATLLLYGAVPLTSSWLYQGGLFLFALLTAAVIAAAVQPEGPVRVALAVAPLRLLGRISYGVYLYHWPVFLWLSPERTGLGPWALLPARLAVTFALAIASYHLLEMPIRERRLVVGRQRLVAVPATLAVVALAIVVITADPPDDPLAELRTEVAAPPELAPPDEVRPIRLLVVGDRYAAEVADGLERWAGSASRDLEVRAVTGVPCGPRLATFLLEGNEYATCEGWVRAWRPVVNDYDPDVVLVTAATWGVSHLFQAGGAESPGPDRPETPTWLRRRVDGAFTLLSSQGARVAVAHFPQRFLPNGKRDITDDTLRLTEVVDDVATTDADVEVLAGAADLPAYPAPTPPDEVVAPSGPPPGDAPATGDPATADGAPADPTTTAPPGEPPPVPPDPSTTAEPVDEAAVDAWSDQIAAQLGPALVDLGAQVRTQSTGVKIMVVGDSVSRSLGDGLEAWAADYGNVAVWNTGSNGCGIARGGKLLDILGEVPDPEICNGWGERWRDQLEDFDPDLVVVLTGVWDLTDRELPGSDQPSHIGEPAYDDYLLAEYQEAVDLLSSEGARVVWLTAPCVGPILPGPLADNPALDAERTHHLNTSVLPRLAAARPELEIVDLFGHVCPDGEYTNELGGISYARPDGLHFSPDSARWVADWLGLRLLSHLSSGT